MCVRKLKNNKTGSSDGLVGELLKYCSTPSLVRSWVTFLCCAATMQSDRDWAHVNKTLISYNQS